jgi:DNA-binding Xre family transcriptional regulator
MRGELPMLELSVCYNNLWKLLIDKKISQADFRREVNIAFTTMKKLRSDEAVAMEILLRICAYLDCNVGDILEFVKTEKAESDEQKPAKP